MKVKEIKEQNGKTVIMTEEIVKPEKLVKRFFRKSYLREAVVKNRSFMAVSHVAGKFYSWVEMPDNSLVPDSLSFQLDTWKEIGI